MSYAASAALQAALYAYLTDLPALQAVPIYDQVPSQAAGTFVLIGPEEVLDASDKSGAGARHRFSLSVITDGAGFADAKEMAVALSDALESANFSLTRGHLVSLQFEKAIAKRIGEGAVRRIDLTFVARIEL